MSDHNRVPVRAADAPPPAGPYSQAIRSGGFLFLAGLAIVLKRSLGRAELDHPLGQAAHLCRYMPKRGKRDRRLS